MPSLRNRVLLVSTLSFTAAVAQSPIPPTADTLARVTALQQSFFDHLKAAHQTCSLAPPTIVMEDVPSFGQYDEKTNTLRTTDWSLLNPQEHAFFVQLAGPGATEQSMRAVFEKAAHGWIFIHELGHWWQNCNGLIGTLSHWRTEYDANRISFGYWQAVDPSIDTLMMSLFHQVVDHMPSPLPPGQDVEQYFNAHYEQLGPTPAYPWYQSKMGVALEQERPAPTFASALAADKR